MPKKRAPGAAKRKITKRARSVNAAVKPELLAFKVADKRTDRYLSLVVIMTGPG